MGRQNPIELDWECIHVGKTVSKPKPHCFEASTTLNTCLGFSFPLTQKNPTTIMRKIEGYISEKACMAYTERTVLACQMCPLSDPLKAVFKRKSTFPDKKKDKSVS